MTLLRFAVLLVLIWPLAARAAGTETLMIHTAAGKDLSFVVEVARTPQEQETGLMNRPSLPFDRGMLFDFGHEQPISMWMKNTLIPLDMLFIDKNGTIQGIAARTVPLSLEVIASPGPVLAVLEVNGGTAERLGIAVGDKVADPLFAKKE